MWTNNFLADVHLLAKYEVNTMVYLYMAIIQYHAIYPLLYKYET